MEQAPRILWGMVAAAVIATISFILIIWQVDPYQADLFIFLLFILSFLIITLGVFIPLIYFYRLKRGVLEPGTLLTASVRQGGITSITLTLLFVMQIVHVLTWWNLILIIVIAVILEMYFRK